MYSFQSESTLYIWLNVKELFARNRSHIWSFSDYNGTRTHNHLVCKQALNHFAKLAKWLSCAVSDCLYDAFDCMFLSCHVRVSEWIHSLYSPECQGTPCSKQAPHLKFMWQQLDSNWRFESHAVTYTGFVLFLSKTSFVLKLFQFSQPLTLHFLQ